MPERLPRRLARLVQEKIDSLPEGVDRDVVQQHFDDVLRKKPAREILFGPSLTTDSHGDQVVEPR